MYGVKCLHTNAHPFDTISCQSKKDVDKRVLCFFVGKEDFFLEKNLPVIPYKGSVFLLSVIFFVEIKSSAS